MNTSQLTCVIQSDPYLAASVKGVFSADQIPKYIHQSLILTLVPSLENIGVPFISMALDGQNSLIAMDTHHNTIMMVFCRAYVVTQEFGFIIRENYRACIRMFVDSSVYIF